MNKISSIVAIISSLVFILYVPFKMGYMTTNFQIVIGFGVSIIWILFCGYVGQYLYGDNNNKSSKKSKDIKYFAWLVFCLLLPVILFSAFTNS
jgi:hypothetical protein